MTVKTGQAWAGTFVTLDATGALATPSTGPAGVLYVDGTSNAATVTITGSNPYKWAVTLPTLTAGQRVDMYITATIATIATAGVVASEQADTAILSDGVVVNSGTVTNLTNLPAVTTDWLTAAAVKADAVTKIQNGLATSAALAVVDANVDAIKVKTDALDNSAVTFVTAVNGTTITVLRGDTLSGALTDIGALTDYVSIDFTVKQNYSQTDDEAIIRIRKNASGTDDGLLRFNGAAASSGLLGSIAIDDLASGDITIALAASCTDDLSTGTYIYDVQMISAAGVKTLTYGKLIVSADVTRLVA